MPLLPPPQPPLANQLNDTILLSRIFFHNSKAILIGKHKAASLILVECLYAPKGLEMLATSKTNRPTSTKVASGTSGGSHTTHQSTSSSSTTKYQTAGVPSAQQQQQTTYGPSNRIGPTIGFRFYCRGDNDIETIKENLKSSN